jgi:hypothetical protein
MKAQADSFKEEPNVRNVNNALQYRARSLLAKLECTVLRLFLNASFIQGEVFTVHLVTTIMKSVHRHVAYTRQHEEACSHTLPAAPRVKCLTCWSSVHPDCVGLLLWELPLMWSRRKIWL